MVEALVGHLRPQHEPWDLGKGLGVVSGALDLLLCFLLPELSIPRIRTFGAGTLRIKLTGDSLPLLAWAFFLPGRG